MERIGGEDTGVPSSVRKVVVSSFIGTTIEWYDYFIYGTAAALVFPALFFPDFSDLAGTLLSFSTFAAVSAISGGAFEVWGWRVPFLLSVVLIAVGLFIRLRIYESPAFSQVRESGTEARMPILDVLRTYPKNVALGVGSRIGIDAAFYVLAVYSLTHISANLGLSQNIGLLAVSIVCYALAPETYRKDIYADEPQERRLVAEQG